MVPHRRVIRLKGGAGSGHRGHRGRPGLRGGSAPGVGGARNVEADWDASSDVYSEIFGDMPREQFEDMFVLPDTHLYMDVEDRLGNIRVKGTWYTPEGTKVGKFTREFTYDNGKKVAHNISLSITEDFQDYGLATSLYDRQISQLRKAGFDRIETYANISIGKYAWAKRGFDYSNPDTAEVKTKYFKTWAKVRGLTTTREDGTTVLKTGADWPVFKSANDVATYKIPGLELSGRDILNPDVPGGMSLGLGKAFMLDQLGHESWDAELKL